MQQIQLWLQLKTNTITLQQKYIKISIHKEEEEVLFEKSFGGILAALLDETADVALLCNVLRKFNSNIDREKNPPTHIHSEVLLARETCQGEPEVPVVTCGRYLAQVRGMKKKQKKKRKKLLSKEIPT